MGDLPHKRARQRRMELGLSQRHVATACGVTQQAYEKFERGGTRRPRYLYELAHVLRVSILWIMTGGEEDAAPVPSPDRNAKDGGGAGLAVYSCAPDAKTRRIDCAFGATNVIDRMPPLPGLENAAGAFILLVEGDACAGVYPHGTRLYLDSNRRPARNCPCVYGDAKGLHLAVYCGSDGGRHCFEDPVSRRKVKVNSSNIKKLYRIAGIIYG